MSLDDKMNRNPELEGHPVLVSINKELNFRRAKSANKP